MSFLTRIASGAEEHADKTALSARGEPFAYGELVAAARGVRALLIEKGCAPRSRVAVVTGDDLIAYASLLAIWSAAAAFVRLNIDYSADRNGQILRDAESPAGRHGPDTDHPVLDEVIDGPDR